MDTSEAIPTPITTPLIVDPTVFEMASMMKICRSFPDFVITQYNCCEEPPMALKMPISCEVSREAVLRHTIADVVLNGDPRGKEQQHAAQRSHYVEVHVQRQLRIVDGVEKGATLREGSRGVVLKAMRYSGERREQRACGVHHVGILLLCERILQLDEESAVVNVFREEGGERLFGHEQCGRSLEVVVLAEREPGQFLHRGNLRDLVGGLLGGFLDSLRYLRTEKKRMGGVGGQVTVNGGGKERGKEGLVGGGKIDRGRGYWNERRKKNSQERTS